MNTIPQTFAPPWGRAERPTLNWGLITALGVDLLLWIAIVDASARLVSRNLS